MSENPQDLRASLKSLSPDQRAQLRKRLGPDGTARLMGTEKAISPAKPLYVDEQTGAAVYPASPSQARMLFLHEFADGSPVYSSHHVFRITGPLDREHLEESLRDMVGRHDGLRTVFQMEEDEMVQMVLPEVRFVLQFKDLLDLPQGSREDEARRLLAEAVQVPFNISTGPLFRVMLVRLDPEEHVILFLLHHIITDGWSMANLYKELSICYNGRLAGRVVKLPDLPIQMTDYSVWLNSQINSGAYDNQFAYWEEKLSNEPPPLDLHPDFPRSSGSTQKGRICVEDLDTDLVEQLGKFARKQNTTLFTVLAAAFKTLIHQRTGETDLLVGIPVANRMRPEVEPVFGCLINTLVLRTDLSGNPSFESLVERVRRTTLDAYSHQELPFDKLVERLKLKRYPGQSPLFQVHLNLQEFGSPELNLEGTDCSTWVIENGTAKFDLSFAISRHPGGWRTRAEYRTDLFREETILDLLRQWKELLIRICAEPSLPLASLFEEPAKSAPSRVTVDTRFLDVPECIHVRFERQVAATPEARALLAHGTSLTYGELNVRANRLAHYLRARGVGPDVAVGLCVNRSPEMIIGILGILKAGGAYLPLDPEAPALRNGAILEDSGSFTVLTVAEYSGQFEADGRHVVLLDDARLLGGESGENPLLNTRPENLVYILYTSGSTGEPKGVMVEHRNLDAYTKSVSRSIPLKRGDYGLLQPLTADTTQTLLTSGLLNGSCLHLISRACSLDASALARYFTENPVDVLKITPSHMAALLGSRRTASLLPRKVLILGGETMPVALVNRIVRLSPSCELWNHYGPTEATVGILTYKVDLGHEYGASESIPIGRPLAGVRVSVVDESGKEVPSGQRGELVVGGKLVARGYLNHPDQTAAVFGVDPSLSGPDGRRYRTGDLVRMLPDGSVEFHGRKDHQVKIRGYRVELGEIEAALASHPSVEGQVVIFREAASHGPRLDAYVVDVREGKKEAASIIDFLKDRLPAAMIPSTVTFLDEIPRTPMGKVDRQALPIPVLGAAMSPADAEPVSDPVLRMIVESCADVLGLDRPDPEDNFFFIGGHSLTAMQLMSRVRNQVGLDLPLQLLFNNPVLLDFAATVQSAIGGKPHFKDENPPTLENSQEVSDPPESRQDKASLNAGLHQLVEAQVRKTPDATAIKFRGITTSFSELNAQANRMAHLLREWGVGENNCVAILTDRSVEMVVAMLAILKAGGAWLPLDPDYPPARLRFMLEDSGARFLVASRKYAGLSGSSVKVLWMEDVGGAVAAFSDEDPAWNGNPSNAAYIVYTSGSTGQPKGAPIPHRAIVNHMLWMQDRFPVGPNDAILQKTPASFDASIWEFFLPLISGATLVLAKPDTHRDPDALIEQVIRNKITVVQFVPLALELFANHSEVGNCRSLKRVFCGGEALPVSTCRRVAAVLNAELVNLYGPSEATIDTSYYVYTRPLSCGFCPLGKPIANVRLYVLDETLQPVPTGEPGELFIAGAGLADGYLNRPDITAERFLPDPFSGQTGRMYASGDRVRLLEDGNLEFLGRMDHQIKLNGFRIEPGEVESAICEYPGIARCAVIKREDIPGEPQLVAYLVREGEAVDISSAGLRSFLKERLPRYMLPSRFECLKSFPLTVNGKLDHTALPTPQSASHGPQPAPAGDSGSLEADILRIFATVLNQPEIRPADDFFDVGGHSLMALRALARIRDIIDKPLTALDFFDHPTAASLAAFIEEREPAPDIPELETAPSGALRVHALFEQQVDRDGERIAVEMNGQGLSYAELNNRANRLAHWLREAGIRPDQPVAIFLGRSPALVVSVLAVLKSGGACLPVDPTYPQARIDTILDAACPEIVITEVGLDGRIAPAGIRKLVLGDDALDRFPGDNPPHGENPEDLAYILYTSGSTGAPKGVQVPHRTLQNLISWQLRESGEGAPRKTLQFASLNFDVSFQEIFSTLACGGTLVVVDEDCRMDMGWLAKTIRTEAIERLFLPYVVLDLLAEELLEGGLESCPLREVITAGEQLKATPSIRRLFKQLPEAVLVNQYGPTETHVVTAHTLRGNPDDWPFLPSIGKPIDNARIYLLDDNMSEVSPGETGEIHVGGIPVARGYLNRDDLTAERFIASPFHPGDVLYKTGDLATLDADGLLKFLGRNDHQVKVRGFRVELGEIESTLMSAPGVRECVVLAREDAAGLARLEAYVIPANTNFPPSPDTLQEFLEERLPDYMVPARFVIRDRFLLNANGKVDRKALVQAVSPAKQAEPVSDETTEGRMEAIWKEVLDLDSIGHDDEFFRIGGHSLLATRLISRIRRIFQVDFPLRVLFEKPTISSLSAHVDQLISKTPESGLITEESKESSASLHAVAELPASFAQQRLWFLDRFEGGSIEYNMPFTFRMRGELDVNVLKQVIAGIVARHGTLRTCFREVDGDPIQAILPGVHAPLRIKRIPEDLKMDPDNWIHEAIRDEAMLPFDLSKAPLVRFILLVLGPADHVFITTFHHVVSDGWSIGVYFKELQALYNALKRGEPYPLDPLEVDYTDYTRWQRNFLSGDELARQLKFWRDQLADLPRLEFPTDFKRPQRMTYAGGRHRIAFPDSFSARLAEFNKAKRVTPFMTFVSAFHVLISRYTGQRDIAVGTPIANRQKVGFEHLIGFFVNTLVIRSRFKDGSGFGKVVEQVRNNILDVFQNQDLPFEKLVEDLNPPRELNRHPLFQVLFALQNAPGSEPQFDGLEAQRISTAGLTTHFDLELHVSSRDGVWEGRFAYSSELFKKETIEELADNFVTLLTNLIEQPDLPVEQVPMLNPRMREHLLYGFNPRIPAEASDALVHELVSEQARRRPDVCALVCDGERLSYADLDRESNQIARFLQKSGAGRDVPVAVCMERSCDLIVALLGILKSGAAYLPIDLACPADRLAFMMKDAAAPVLLTQRHLTTDLPEGPWHLTCLDADESPVKAFTDEAVPVTGSPDDLAYIIYTSGSTGQPKGVQVTHRNVTRLFDATHPWFAFDESDVWSLFHSCAFDFSVWEIWGALIYGGRLVIVPHETSRSPSEFWKLLLSESVTVLNQTPSAFKQLIAAEPEREEAPPSSLRYVILGGEALDLRSLGSWFDRHGDASPRLVNMYGITETTVHVTYRPLTRGDLDSGSVIGEPIPDLQVYLLDGNLEPVPIGLPGEIFVGGQGVARGYLNRPELNAECFLEDPFRPGSGSRLYRSGDLARRLRNGDLEYIGRADDQIQLRGFRIEAGEIESVLLLYPNFKDAKVIMREDVPGDQRLVAYVITNGGQEAAFADVRTFAARKLPDYMLPSAVVYLDAFPLTPDGKLDTKALPAPKASRDQAETAFVAAKSEIEAALCDVWKQVLGVDEVGIHDNFFELGGHSLLATQVAYRLQAILHKPVSIRTLFEHPTVAALLEIIDLEPVQEPLARPARPEAKVVRAPLSFVQERIWFIEQLEGGHQFHIPLVVRLRGALDANALEAALKALVRRHGALRTAFVDEDGHPVQVLRDSVDFSLSCGDLAEVDPEDADTELNRVVQGFFSRPFDLGRAPLFRCRLLRICENEHVLVLVLHHLVSDGWSIQLLRNELDLLYRSETTGLPVKLPDLPLSYIEFSQAQRANLMGERLEALKKYWLSTLDGAPALSIFPPDHERSSGVYRKSGNLTTELSPALSGSLRRFCGLEGVTAFSFMLSVFRLLLARHSGQDDLVIGTPVLGRNHEDLENVIGCFLGTIPLRLRIDQDETFRETLKQVQNGNLDAFAHQDLPFEQLVEAVRPERSLSHSPVFQVLFNFFNAHRTDLSLGDLEVTPVELEDLEAKYDMTVYVSDETDGIRISVVYNASLYEAATIRVLTDQYIALLEAVLAAPQRRLSEYTLKAEGADRLLVDPGKPLSRPFKVPVTRQFVEIARQYPDHPALIREGEQMNYRSLAERSAAVAVTLLRKGVQAGDVVALPGSRSFSMIVAMIGIMRARAVVLLVDPALPEARKSLMLKEAGTAWCLDDEAGVPLPGEDTFKRIILSQQDPELVSRTELPDPDPVSAAYVFFTSGTTGVPKGILGNHKGLSHFIDWERSMLEVNEADRVAQLTGYSFDVILRDIFLPLTSGAAVCLLPDSVSAQGEDVVEWIRQSEVSVIHTVPSVVETWFSDQEEILDLPALRWALIAGEPLKAGLINRWRRCFGSTTRLMNLYGATETTLAKTWYMIPDDPQPGVQPIGRPMPETQVLILGSGNRPCGVREPGQIAIRTPFMSSGYINGSAAERTRFIQNPFREDPSDQIYLTGDIGYLDPTGLLRIFGRLDDQVKLRGVRIEPTEIAAQLEQHKSVRQAFVNVQEADDGDRMLVAYIVFDGGPSAVSVPEIRAYLRGLLPEYLIPGAFVPLEKLPLTANGKVDRRALPKPETSRSSLTVSFDPPRTPTEEAIAEIWKTILKLDAVGRQDHFFDLGGHSLLATRVIARMRQQVSGNISLRAIFEHPTIESLALAIDGEEEQAELDMAKEAHEKIVPVSFAQQRIWFLDKFKGSSREYNVAGALRLKGRLNVEALQKALQSLVDRHESLRTRFLEQTGEPFQVVEPSYQFIIEFEDLSADVETLQEGRLQEIVDTFRSHSFDLKKLPLLMIKLVRIGDDEHILLRNIHHIISDGWSLGVFNRELTALYAAYVSGTDCDLKPLAIQYPEFAKRQRENLSGSFLDSQILYWREQLKATPSLDLPTDFPRPLRQTFGGAHQSFEIPESVIERLNTFNHQERFTPFMTLMAAFNAVLSRYSGETDITIGTPVANRQQIEHEDLIGFFVNTLPIRTDMSGNPDFRSLVQRVREVTLDAFAYQDLPFEKVVEVLNPQRDMGRHPIFQIIFAVQNAPGGSLQFPGIEVSPHPMKSTTTHFDLEFHLMPEDGRCRGTIVYNTDLFLPATISRLKTHYINLLTACLESPDLPVEEVDILSPEERKQLLVDWNRTETDYPRNASIHEVFREQAVRAPEAVALVQDGRRLTYGELDVWSDRLAHRLIRDGAKVGDRVGVCLDRSPELVAAFLGILKAGCAYVPLARDYPVDRLKFMVEDAGLKTVIVDSGFPVELHDEPVRLIDCSEIAVSMDDEGQTVPQVGVAATDAAYVIYTSGSTGRPKGTVIPHRGVVRLVKGQDYADFGPDQRFLLLASPSFDASTFEIWAPLLNGGSAAIYTDRFVDPPVLEEVLRKHKVTCLWLTTGLFNLIVDTSPAMLGFVRHVLTGGELLSTGHVKKARALHPDLRLTNCYGPTECTTFATFNELLTRQGEPLSASIGRPIAHTQAYILDGLRQPVPVGVVGELYLGGDGLSTGYLNQPELTKERFVPNPFPDNTGDRLYRTGDICRYLPDGRIEFIGRVDNQVKVRGFRVEIGEIEYVLNQHPSVEKGAIRVSRDSTGIVNLIAYFVPRRDRAQLAKSEVKAFLSARLPDYAVPSVFESVRAFPLTPNGKVDFAALPEPGLNRGSEEQTEPCREDLPLESQLIALWEKLFQRPGIKRDDNFFNLGGHSLMAARLAAEIESYFGRSIPIAALFEAPTVEQLAARLKEDDESGRSQCLVTLQPNGSKIPLFCIHGWGGEVFGFLDLARELAPERPVYGLQAIGLDGKVPRHTSVEEMAAYYAEEISNFYPDGPVHLIGYSAGGWIAYAVAQELLQRGRTINLSMLDTGMSSKIPYWLYAATKTIHLLGRLPHHIRFWYGLPRKEKWEYISDRFRWLRVNFLRDITLLLKNRAEGDSEPAQNDDTSEGPKAFEMDYFILLAGNYRPRPYPGDLTLFAAKGSRWYSRIFWKFMIRGDINIHYVDGGHHGLIDQYHVGNFSILFRKVLDRLDCS